MSKMHNGKPEDRLSALGLLLKARNTLKQHDDLNDQFIGGQISFAELVTKQLYFQKQIIEYRERAEKIDPTARIGMLYDN